MKQFTKLMAMLLFTAATQYSCINDADVAIPDKTQSDSNGNVALFLEIPNVPASRSAESSGVTEEGSKEEYAVKTLTVYFFDSATKTFVDSQPLENITLAGTSGQKIHYTANKITMKPGTYNVFAIANGEAITADIATQDSDIQRRKDSKCTRERIRNDQPWCRKSECRSKQAHRFRQSNRHFH